MLSVIVNSTEYALDDNSLCTLVGHDGWGALQIERFSSQGSLQDGDSDLGFKVKPRIGKLTLMFKESDLDVMYLKRKELIDIFSPKGDLTLKWVFGYGTRYIDCKFYDDLSFAWTPRAWAAQKFSLTLKCNDPTFYDPTVQSVTFGLQTGIDFIVPTVVPTYIDSENLNQIVDIIYPGNWYSYPVIRITGPITDCIIRNLTTGDVLDFTGYTLAGGKYLDIDCRYTEKTVIDSDGNSQIDMLTDDSDLATFQLAENSTNQIQVTGENVTWQTEVKMDYYERYSGI